MELPAKPLEERELASVECRVVSRDGADEQPEPNCSASQGELLDRRLFDFGTLDAAELGARDANARAGTSWLTPLEFRAPLISRPSSKRVLVDAASASYAILLRLPTFGIVLYGPAPPLTRGVRAASGSAGEPVENSRDLPEGSLARLRREIAHLASASEVWTSESVG